MTTVRICLALVAANLRAELQYRANFVLMLVVGLAWDGTAFLVIWVTLTHFHAIGGWSLSELTFLYGLQLFSAGLTTLAFGFAQQNIFEWLVREGEFDRYLVRPLAPLLQLITSRIHVPILGSLLGSATLLLIGATHIHVEWSPLTVGYLGWAISGACLMQAAIYLCVNSLVFRLLSVGMLTNVIGDFSKYGNYPLKIYTGPVRFFLTFILPQAFMGYFPVTVLLHRTGELRVPSIVAYLSPLAGLLCVVPAYFLFTYQLRNYQSAGH
jgi:ABC-2 type transport system permease protein